MKKYNLLQAILSTKKAGNIGRESCLALQNRRLQGLVKYAKRHSPYFRNLYNGIDGDCFSLADLPPTNKVELMSSFNDWMTDAAVTYDIVRNFMKDPDNIGRKLHGKYLIHTTSGSTGNPSIVLTDSTVFNASAAISVLRAFAHKSDLQEYIKRGKKTAGLYAVNGFYLASGSMKYNQRRMPWRKNQLAVDILAPINEIVQALNEFQPAMLGSYPSMLELLIPEQKAGRLHISPVLIMPAGEFLREDLRKELESTFHCNVQTSYSCTEAGIIACECEHGRLHINEDWCIVEAVDESNQPVPYGMPGKKALITNLANYAQPFIRYELNDRITVHDEACECGKTFRWLEIEGRTDEILEFKNGVRIAPMALFALLKKIDEIKRYQIIQHDGDKLEVRLVSEYKPIAFEKARLSIQQYLKSKNTTAQIYLSDTEPQVHPKSGKFRSVYRQ